MEEPRPKPRKHKLPRKGVNYKQGSGILPPLSGKLAVEIKCYCFFHSKQLIALGPSKDRFKATMMKNKWVVFQGDGWTDTVNGDYWEQPVRGEATMLLFQARKFGLVQDITRMSQISKGVVVPEGFE